MRPQEIIAIKRDGGELTDEHIGEFIRGVCDSSWADYQISALVMAIFTRGLNEREGETLVREMLHSGEVLDFSEIDAPKADKHSTGGVGDKTSLIIAPIVAACGVAVPMISGRGLGHTGGTLDKLESIPGYDVRLSKEQFHVVIEKCGFAMAGQTAEIAPADKKLYALRDATATVPYIPLIVASIMSKKLAENLDALVLDVKTGEGAFMQSLEDSKTLAKALVDCGAKFGVRTEAVVSDMSEPLGAYVGNSVEVYECIKILRGEAEPQMRQTAELSVELSARLLKLANLCSDHSEAIALAESKISNGEALEKFRKNCELQGGDVSVFEDPEKLLDSNLHQFEIESETGGFVSSVDALAVGEAIVAIGGGRTMADDKLDHSVGFHCNAKTGDEIKRSESLGTIFCRDANQFDSVSEKLRNAYTISANPVEMSELIKAVIQ
ncbi:MAG: thymidine phosphorylase [Pyrinomonadaceae bacterium]